MKSKVKFTAFVVASIDGKIAKDSKSGAPWASKEDWLFFQQSLKKFDAVVVGTSTFKVAQKNLNKRNTVVFTSRVGKFKTVGSVTFFNPSRANVADFLKHNNYKKVAILGGPKVYSYFLEKGMLDELYVTIEPLIFTEGVNMFTGDKFTKYKLKLESVKKLNTQGTLLLKYNAN